MAGTLVMFDSWKEELLLGNVGFSDSFRCALLSAGWTPSIDISSMSLSICSFIAASASNQAGARFTGAADRKVAPPGGGTLSDQITKTADGVIKLDLSDLVFTASSGINMDVQYLVGYASAVDTPAFYWEISTGALTVSQFTVQWPAAGLFETSDNV